jgi:ribosomal protein S4
MNIWMCCYEGGVVKSKGEARRLVEQGGVRLDGATIQCESTRNVMLGRRRRRTW